MNILLEKELSRSEQNLNLKVIAYTWYLIIKEKAESNQSSENYGEFAKTIEQWEYLEKENDHFDLFVLQLFQVNSIQRQDQQIIQIKREVAINYVRFVGVHRIQNEQHQVIFQILRIVLKDEALS